jgi:hypothetical protein
MAWHAGGDKHLPLADRDRDWDGDAARDRIFKWAGSEDGFDSKKVQRAFFAFNDEELDKKSSYKLPFADVIGGKLTAIPQAIFAVAQVLEGARGGVDLPESVQRDVRKIVETYYQQMGDEVPW